MNNPFIKKMYYAMTLDPVHVGTGGYRLGRVDNTITREPGTNLPKIPGSSIAGVTRSYTAMHPEVDRFPACAGISEKKKSSHCGQPNCPVCVGFGFSKGTINQSFQGMAQFSDAKLLFFPVHSMLGPVWITSQSILREHEISIELSDWKKFRSFGPSCPEHKLNLGWLMLEQEGTVTELLNNHFSQVPKDIRERVLLVSDKIFSRVINDNLEVRTSVAIDPNTGAAEEGALFTYEAIPRATILWFDITYNKPEKFRIGDQVILLPPLTNIQDPFGRTGPIDQAGYLATYVEKGLDYIEALGVGGMSTRGFGRAKIIHGGAI